MKVLKKDFKAWLESYGLEQVGVREEAHICPLANFISEKVKPGIHWIAVEGDIVEYGSMNGRYHAVKLPKWAQKFVEEIDRYERDDDYDEFDPCDWYAVYGDEALEVLDGISKKRQQG